MLQLYASALERMVVAQQEATAYDAFVKLPRDVQNVVSEVVRTRYLKRRKQPEWTLEKYIKDGQVHWKTVYVGPGSKLRPVRVDDWLKSQPVIMLALLLEREAEQFRLSNVPLYQKMRRMAERVKRFNKTLERQRLRRDFMIEVVEPIVQAVKPHVMHWFYGDRSPMNRMDVRYMKSLRGRREGIENVRRQLTKWLERNDPDNNKTKVIDAVLDQLFSDE